jgi:hypothetical protein
MIKLNRRLLGISLGAVTFAAGVAFSTRADAAIDWAVTVGLVSITTDGTGTVASITYRQMNVEKTVKGCGAKLDALPHLMEHYRQSKAVDLGIENNCLKQVRTRK